MSGQRNTKKDTVLQETDLSHESVSSLFKTWQDEEEADDCGAMDDFAFTPTSSRSSVRDVFEGTDVKSSKILELPPLQDNKPMKKTEDKKRKRPLCTFLNHIGTRLSSSSNTSVASESDLVSEVSSLPSLAEEEDVLAKRFSFGPDMSLMEEPPAAKRHKKLSLPLMKNIRIPEVDPKLKDDPKMKEFKAKLETLMADLKKTRAELKQVCGVAES